MKVLKCPCGCHLEEFSKEEVKLKSVCMSCNCGHSPSGKRHPLTTRNWLYHHYIDDGKIIPSKEKESRQRKRKE